MDRLNHKRFLVFSSIGDKCRVNYWVNKDRIYDVCLAYYGDSDFSSTEGIDFFIKNADYKIPNFLRCFEKFNELLEYDYYFFIDDDLIIDQYTIEGVLRVSQGYHLDLCQPSLARGSYTYWPQLMNKEYVYMQYTNFVEIGCFCMSRELLRKTLPYFYLIKSGTGLDIIFAKVLEHYKNKIAVLHFLQFTHPYRPKEETIRGTIPDFGKDFMRRDKRIRFCLGMWKSKKSLIGGFKFKIHKTVWEKDTPFCLKIKYLLADIIGRNKITKLAVEYCYRRIKKVRK